MGTEKFCFPFTFFNKCSSQITNENKLPDISFFFIELDERILISILGNGIKVEKRLEKLILFPKNESEKMDFHFSLTGYRKNFYSKFKMFKIFSLFLHSNAQSSHRFPRACKMNILLIMDQSSSTKV